MNKNHIIFLLLCLLPVLLSAQDFSGTWTGILTQDGKPAQFIYEIELSQHGNKVSGTATSRDEKGGAEAAFEMGGVWDGSMLTLQEVKQLKPENARWCLKHIRLTYIEKADGIFLEGPWEAEGCTPGRISLKSGTSPALPAGAGPRSPSRQLSSAPAISGKFTGYLSQSDRDYGFYFDMHFNEDGTGRSSINSDGEGGNATHAFNWSYNKENNELTFEERAVTEKSVETWPWCIKSARLAFEQEDHRLSLSGNWKGYIEGHDPRTGGCAPGFLYVEQPVFMQEDLVIEKEADKPVVSTPSGVQPYQKQTKREVEVDRVLEVRNTTVRIRVWDNGTVDGDVLSLFVNGEMILENYRVTRRKHETIIKLDKPVNYLILHAINLGSITPNTVAVSVDDGIEEQVVIMSSNLDKSGAVMIRQFKVGK